jgi:hypothetical protein
MPNENHTDTPSADPERQPPPQSPMTPAAPQENKMGEQSSGRSDDKNNRTVKLEEDIRNGERWLIGVSAAAVILNAVIALIYYGQLKEMRKATKASQKAAIAATSAATTASNTLQFARDQFRIEQRPYLWIQDIGFVDEKRNNLFSDRALWTYLGTNEQPVVNVGLNNFGRSPAVHARSTQLEVILDETNKALKRAKEWTPKYDNRIDMMLFPSTRGGTMFPSVHLPVIDQKLHDSLAHGKKAAFLLGAVSYTDIIQPDFESLLPFFYLLHR